MTVWLSFMADVTAVICISFVNVTVLMSNTPVTTIEPLETFQPFKLTACSLPQHAHLSLSPHVPTDSDPSPLQISPCNLGSVHPIRWKASALSAQAKV